MSYRISRANGDFYANIPSNIILGPNNPSSAPAPINLIGRNKVSYGEAQNENFLWLVENFSGPNPPTAPVKGQLWYDYTNDVGAGGELKISPKDNSLANEWLTVVVVGESSTEPSQSTNGRMLIYQQDTLKVRMNDAWHTITTEVPQDRLLQTLLDPRNNAALHNGENTIIELTSSAEYVVAKFNEGGYITSAGLLDGVEQGVLRYSSVYQWEADIVARSATDSSVYKVWKVKGSFHVLPAASQTGTADPRRIVPFNRNTLNYEIITEATGTESWDVYARSSNMEPDASVTDPTEILDGDYYGLDFVCTSGTNSTIQTQWSVFLRMTGIPQSLSPDL